MGVTDSMAIQLRIALAGFSALVLAIPLASQQIPITEVCNAAFSQGIRDNWHLFTERQQFEAYQFRLCQTKFSSYQTFQSTGSSLGLDIPLAEGLLGLGGSYDQKSAQFQQQYEKFCTSTYFSASDHLRYQSYVSQISSALTQSWNRCQELHLDAYLKAKGVFIAITPMGQTEQFVARVNIKTELSGNVEISALNPDQSVVCTRGGTKVGPGTTIPIREFSLTCHKDPSAEIAYSVETNFGQSNEVRVPSGTQKMAELLGNIEKMRAAFDAQFLQQQEKLDRLTAELVASQLLVLDGSVEGIGADERRVDFATEFRDRPIVSAGFIFLDAGPPHQNVRISFEITAIDTKGFRYKMYTWAGTEIHGVKVRWTAAGVRK